MKPSRMIIALLLVVSVVCDSFSQEDRAFIVRRTTGNASNTKGETFALLIGINKYDSTGINDLNFCVRDVKKMAETLKKMGIPEENIVLMHDEAAEDLKPTRNRILRQLIVTLGKLTKDDRLIFAFSGHGAQSPANQPIRKAYLVPADGYDSMPQTLIDREEVFGMIDKCPAVKKLAFIDACRAEMFDLSSRSSTDMMVLTEPIGDFDYGFAVLASCQQDQKSYEDKNLQHGVFTYFVIKGLEGEAWNQDGSLTFDGLFQYVMRNTRNHVVNVMKKTPQVPTCAGDHSGLVIRPPLTPQPLIFTAEEQAEIDRFIAKYGSDVNAVVTSEDYETIHSDGISASSLVRYDETLLQCAASKWGVAVTKYLVSKGADVHVKDDYGGTPLHSAAERGNIEVVKFLVAQRANVHAKTDDGGTPLHFAAERGNFEVVKFLVEQGADVHAKGDSGVTPLYFAARSGNIEVVKLLVEQGAKVNVQTDYGMTPLHDAALRGNIEVIKFLVEQGADVNAKIDDGIFSGATPLHFVAERGNIEVVKFLVAQRANVHAKTDDGKTPLHFAVLNGNIEVVKYLVSQRADVNAKNNYDQTPLDWANSDEIKNYLKSKGAKSGKE